MEKPTSPSSNQNTTSASAATLGNQNYVSPPQSPLQTHHQYSYHQDLNNDFSSMYNFIFSPKSTLPHSLSITPSSCSSSDDLHVNLKLTSNAMATEHRLNQARLVLEYQQLCDHFDLCFSRLQALIAELETLRRENSDLRVANTELIKLLSLSSQAAMNNRNLQREELQDLNVKRWERRNNKMQKNSVPKSVSFRSSYLKVNQQQGSSDQQRVVNPSTRVFEARREEKAIELEVCNQGMVKTELCNKWQETGTCPYGSHCQFAHGITELRPVIRHPRYKTEVCRMVLAGEECPYGHRCHFRHFLTEQERLLISR